MNVGLPGTGIGGLFYLLTAFMILAYELVMTVRGRSNLGRWKVVGEQVGITVTMIIAAIVTNSLISTYLLKKTAPPAASHTVAGAVLSFYATHPIFVPVTLLFLVLCAVQIAHAILTRAASPR